MTQQTVNSDSDIDRRLQMLGIADRDNWEIESSDKDVYTASYIVVRPDWILKSKNSESRLIVSFKSRSLRKDKYPSNYEALQITIESIVLERYFEYNFGISPMIAKVILYGNNQKRAIEYDEHDKYIVKKVAKAWSQKHKKPIAGSKLARILSGGNFNKVSEE